MEELLSDAPQHIRGPALEELGQLPMSDLECLWGVSGFPLAAGEASSLKRRMKNPTALDRLAQRAKVSRVLAEARDLGLYEVLGDATSDVVDEAGQ